MGLSLIIFTQKADLRPQETQRNIEDPLNIKSRITSQEKVVRRSSSRRRFSQILECQEEEDEGERLYCDRICAYSTLRRRSGRRRDEEK